MNPPDNAAVLSVGSPWSRWRNGGLKRICCCRLMRVMGLEAIYQKPNTSKGHPDH